MSKITSKRKEGLLMNKELKKRKICFKGKIVNIGVDMHKRSWQITVLVEGTIFFAVTMSRPNYPAFKKLLTQFDGNIVRVAYEAGPCGFELFDRLTADSVECIVAPPALIPTEIGNRVKTDKKDSFKLAQLLEKNMLKKVHVLSAQERAHRQLVRTRRQIVNHRSSVMRQIKSFLLFHNMEIPFLSAQHWTTPFITWLDELDLGDQYLNRSLRALLDLFYYLNGAMKTMTQEVIELSKIEKYARRVQILKSIPGIGDLSAIEILVELQDINRFKTEDQLAAYLGLTPSQYSSGEHIRMGRITHGGNSRIRTALVESSWILIGRDPAMRKKYETIKYRRGAKRAIIAVARILSSRIRRILIDQVPYKIGFQSFNLSC
jgi:transposase